MRILITGATGFLGGYVLEEAVQQGHSCVCMTRSLPREGLYQHPNVQWIEGGLRDDWAEAFAQAGAVIHLASAGVSPQKATREQYFQANVTDSLLFIESAVDAGVSKVIACVSCFEYGASGERYAKIPMDAPLEPINAYGASKAAATVALSALCREKKFQLSVLRPFHFYGEGQHEANLWPSLKKSALAGGNFEMTPGEQLRDYAPVEMMAEQFIAALSSKTPFGLPRISNLGSGKVVSLREFCEDWWQTFEAKGRLLVGAQPYRKGEVMRFVPELKV
jgi:nucleoside-diphosphate-sugar epimerase